MNAPRQPTRRRLDHLRAPIDDVGIGGRQDGLTIDGINTNEDAESTLDVPQCPVSDRGRRTIDSVVGRDRTRRRPPGPPMNPAIPHTTKQLPEDAQSRTAKFQTMMFEVTVDPANGAIHATHDEHPSLHACATTLEGLAIELAQALAGHVQHATTHSDADFNPRGRRD